MKEDDARKMECPVKTYCVNEIAVIQDHAPPLYAQAPCTASECIMWRKDFHHDNGQTYYRNGDGYCGLAGVQ